MAEILKVLGLNNLQELALYMQKCRYQCEHSADDYAREDYFKERREFSEDYKANYMEYMGVALAEFN